MAFTGPRTIIIVLLATIVAFAAFLPTLQTDTRPNAFLAPDNPALLYREKVRDVFGLSDPLIIALVDRGPQGVFNPASLALLQSLTDEIGELANIDETRVLSLASEKNIVATPDGMNIEPFLDPLPETQAQADAIRQATFDFPLFMGNLISKDGEIALIVAELNDEHAVEATYEQVKAIADQASNGTIEVHVAGEGAIAGYLSKYIDIDSKRLNPLAWLLIMLTLYIAYRRLSPLLLANVIIAASALISLGLMAALGIPFYMITSALPVILIGISVADTIHIYSHYFELQAKNPEADVTTLVNQTVSEMWRPVTLTTLTTMAGFLGLYFSAYMPPFKYFGLFAAVGVAVAWLYSLVFLPAAMKLSKPQISPAFQKQFSAQGTDWFGRLMQGLGRFTQRFAVALIAVAAVLVVLGTLAASRIIVDEEPITIFHPSEPLFQADQVMNQHLAGTNALDVVIEASDPDGLLQPENLKRIEALQAYAEGLPHVGGSTSIVDYLKQMNRAIKGGSPDDYALPDSEDLIAQYFLIYSATSDSADFEEEIDYDYQTANVRLNLNTGSYNKFRPAVESLEQYIASEFNTPNLKATLSGRVNLNYHWIGDLGSSHFTGLGYALLLAWIVSSLLFRSAWAGFYTLIPVAGAILLIYAIMVLLNMGIGVGTSMFAAVALGLGVDFSIHTLERFRVLYCAEQGDWARVFDEFYKTTGRALFFNFLAIACGFGILITSKVGSLNNFGIMILASITTSFIASMTLLPAMLRLFRPRFVTAYNPQATKQAFEWRTLAAIVAVAALALFLLAPGASAQSTASEEVPASAIEEQATLTAEEVVQRINATDDGQFVTRKLSMELIDRRGKKRERDTVVYRKYYGEEMRTIVFYTKPTNVRNTSFLTWDYPDTGQADDQWLYLPALRKVRRISSADRGDYFMGTDFTYEDIKLDGKVSLNDYNYTLVATPQDSADDNYQIAATPKSDEIARELGYSRIVFWVDSNSWLVVKGEFTDIKGARLKTLHVSEIALIDEIWTRKNIALENHKTGHQTIFTFSEIDYVTPVDDRLFNKQSMERGAP